jgi:hypothetical protein
MNRSFSSSARRSLGQLALLLFAAIVSSPAYAYVQKKATNIFYTAEVGGTLTGSFSTITEALNHVCVNNGFPLGVYPPYAAQREQNAANDPWNEGITGGPFATHIAVSDIQCAASNASGWNRRRSRRQSHITQIHLRHQTSRPADCIDRRPGGPVCPVRRFRVYRLRRKRQRRFQDGLERQRHRVYAIQRAEP